MIEPISVQQSSMRKKSTLQMKVFPVSNCSFSKIFFVKNSLEGAMADLSFGDKF